MNKKKQVDDGEGKARQSESLEEQVIDEVSDSKEIHALSLVECTTVEVSTHIIHNGSCLRTLENTLLSSCFLC